MRTPGRMELRVINGASSDEDDETDDSKGRLESDDDSLDDGDRAETSSEKRSIEGGRRYC